MFHRSQDADHLGLKELHLGSPSGGTDPHGQWVALALSLLIDKVHPRMEDHSVPSVMVDVAGQPLRFVVLPMV